MAEYQQDTTKFPPGWDCKYDTNSGKCYYINYITKAMSLEDPRIRYRQLQNEKASMESIPMQPMHGSPYHVYPANSYPAVQAFQGSFNNNYNNNSINSTAPVYNVSSSASPLLASNRHHNIEISPLLRHSSSSPHTPRIMSQLVKQQQQQHLYYQQQQQTTGIQPTTSLTGIQETSFITPAETDAAVAKINTMFPTASDAHIRLLLKKYLKSIFPKADETLLLDILANADNNVQIASEKLLSMGYTKRDTATAPRLSNRNKVGGLDKSGQHLNAGGNIDDGRQQSIQPPKIRTNEEKNKIKAHLQNLYPDVAGRIIVMALESVDYSQDKACQIMKIVMQDEKGAAGCTATEIDTTDTSVIGKDKQSTQPERPNDSLIHSSVESSQPPQPLPSSAQLSSPQPHHETQPLKSTQLEPLQHKCDENQADTTPMVVNANLIDSKYISLAPTSFSSSSMTNANELVYRKTTTQSADGKFKRTTIKSTTTAAGAYHHRAKGKSYENSAIKSTPGNDNGENDGHNDSGGDNKNGENNIETIVTKSSNNFRSMIKRIQTDGANAELCHGPNENLLLADYIAWNGANPDLCAGGQKARARGADPTLLRQGRPKSLNHGANGDLYKGPNASLAKGSIYTQITRHSTDVKCN